MFLAKIIGNVVATQKEPTLEGCKLLVVSPLALGPDEKTKSSLVAVDTIGAGIGETVLVSSGSSARNALKANVVADAAVVGIVDTVQIEKDD